MPSTTNALLRQYAKLTEFLGLALGPDYEVALYDLTAPARPIIAIANSHISGRKPGDPLTSEALNALADQDGEGKDYCLHYAGVTLNGKELRSSTMFIRQDARLAGMLCIHFDDSRYQAVIEQILGLCHPDPFVEQLIQPEGDAGLIPELEARPAEAMALESIRRALERLGVPADRLTAGERMEIIAELEADGVFLLKGAVKDAASGLKCSQASIYRYLARIKK